MSPRCRPGGCTWLVAGMLGWWWSSSSLAQPAAELAQWRQTIEAQRAEVERSFTSAQAACYQQFAVTDCVLEAKKKRSNALAELKRQDVVLNDEERKRKAATQMRKLDERISLEAEQNAAAQRAQRAEAASAARQRAAERLTLPATPVPGQPASQRASEHRSNVAPGGAPRESSPKATRSLDTSQAQHSFNRKQRQAAERQAEVDQSRRERKQPLAAPLPPNGLAPTPLAPQLLTPAPKKPTS